MIRFREVPPTDAGDVAHELAHVLVALDGVAAVGCSTPAGDQMSAALSGICSHPGVHAYLHAYRFDLVRIYEREVDSALKQLAGMREPTEPLHIGLWCLNYAKLRLMYEQMRTLRLDPGEDRHETFFAATFPRTHEVAVDVLAAIHAEGIDTVAGQEQVLNMLIDRFGLLRLGSDPIDRSRPAFQVIRTQPRP